jgi:hypothetical protein
LPLIAPIQHSRYLIQKERLILLEMKKMIKKIKLTLFSKESQFVNKESLSKVTKLMDLIVITTKREVTLKHHMDLNSMREIITGSFVTDTLDWVLVS